MCKSGYSHATFILDNSGSMASMREQTIAGYNDFLTKQKADPGTMTFSLFQFLREPLRGVTTPAQPTAVEPQALVQCNYDFVDIQSVPPLTTDTYQCLTGTPLLDAMGVAMSQTGTKLAAMAEDQRPEKVFFVTLTDGQELHSKVYNRQQINDMIKHQKDVYSWEFIYLGANQDAIAVGASYGFQQDASMNYVATAAGMTSTYNATSAAITRSKISGQSVAYTEAERNAAMGIGDVES